MYELEEVKLLLGCVPRLWATCTIEDSHGESQSFKVAPGVRTMHFLILRPTLTPMHLHRRSDEQPETAGPDRLAYNVIVYARS